MAKHLIRLVREADAGAVLAIYEPYIKDTAVTFEYQTPTEDEFAKRIKNISAVYPYLVCFQNGKIAGYAYAKRQMARTAYQWNAELSVYIDQAFFNIGMGKALYTCLIEILKLQNVVNVYGGVALPNLRSENLHKSLGFNKLGIYHHTGYKCGAWHDVLWFEKSINRYDTEPLPFKTIKEIDRETVNQILSQYSRMIKDG